MKQYSHKFVAIALALGAVFYLVTLADTNAQQSHTPFKTSEEISQDTPVAFPADI